MKIEIEEIDSCNRKLKLEIPLKTYQSELSQYFKKLSHQVKVPGFRKGKVPRSMLEKKYGPEVKKEVLTQLVSDSLSQAIDEKKLRTIGDPKQLQIEAEEGTDISVSANIEIIPEFETKDLSDLEIELTVNRVTDEDIDKVIESYREKLAKTIQVENRPVETGDLIKVDFEGTLDGKPFENGASQDYVIQVGSKDLIEGFDEAVLGMETGQVRDFNLDLSTDHPNKEIAGKEVSFHVVLKGIQMKELPDIDDEFAKQVDPGAKYETLEALRLEIKEKLEEFEIKQARKSAQDDLAKKLGDENPFDVPEGLVQDQIKFMQSKDNESSKSADQSSEEDDAKAKPQDEATYREQAVKVLQQELVIGKLAEQYDVEVSENEINQELKNLLSLMGGGDFEKSKQQWAKSGALLRLHSRMRREKALKLLLDKVKIKEQKVDRKENTTDNG